MDPMRQAKLLRGYCLTQPGEESHVWQRYAVTASVVVDSVACTSGKHRSIISTSGGNPTDVMVPWWDF